MFTIQFAMIGINLAKQGLQRYSVNELGKTRLCSGIPFPIAENRPDNAVIPSAGMACCAAEGAASS